MFSKKDVGKDVVWNATFGRMLGKIVKVEFNKYDVQGNDMVTIQFEWKGKKETMSFGQSSIEHTGMKIV